MRKDLNLSARLEHTIWPSANFSKSLSASGFMEHAFSLDIEFVLCCMNCWIALHFLCFKRIVLDDRYVKEQRNEQRAPIK